MQSNSKIQVTNAPTILVPGGNGFIGRYTVAALKRRGVQTIIGTRRVSSSDTELKVRFHESLIEKAWEETLEGVDAVINTVGILRERKAESFDKIHHLAVSALSRACKKRNIPLVHMSALGIDGLVKNEFANSKLRGETAIINSGCRGTVVRSSIVNAPDGYGSGWMYQVAKWPIWLVPGGATKLLCPIEAKDLGEALANLALSHLRQNNKKVKILEVGCSENFTLQKYLQKLRVEQRCLPVAPFFIIRVPRIVAKLFAKVFDVFHLTPYSIGHHQLLENDNTPNSNCLAQILGRAPSVVGKSLDESNSNKSVFKHKDAELINQ